MSTLQRIAPALGTGVFVAVAAAYIWAVNPNEGGLYPVCPTQAILGIDCPACGGLRGSHALLRGDLAGAADNNILLFLLVPVLAFVWWRWLVASWKATPEMGSTQSHAPEESTSKLLIITLIVVLVFGVVRNFLPYLGSGIG
ncbi:MAG: DUF2752 domain-containing protein [Candidatus Nanopelagicales bacterium]|nr:DUF2752 domain-containing protein [Candidatus Nanopelagicales bacterium]